VVVRKLGPVRVAIGALLLIAVGVVVLYLIPSRNDYVFLPDRAHALAPLVDVPNERRPTDGGGIYFVDVRFRKARLLEQLFPALAGSEATVVPVHAVRGPGVSDTEQRRQDLHDMAVSQRVAAAVALRRLGYKVAGHATGVIVDTFLDTHVPAARQLEPGDRIVAVEGRPTPTLARLHAVLAGRKPGDRIRIGYVRRGHRREATVQTIRDRDAHGRALIGISGEQAFTLKLPIRVRIDTHGVGGPSAGLAFALDLMEELGRDVDHGHKVAATGALAPDGTVEEIGGIKQKTVGARQARVDVFLVPRKNAREARKYAHGLRVIAVDNFPQALHALATLPVESHAGA
jgi:PDZ domain-containing protein